MGTGCLFQFTYCVPILDFISTRNMKMTTISVTGEYIKLVKP